MELVVDSKAVLEEQHENSEAEEAVGPEFDAAHEDMDTEGLVQDELMILEVTVSATARLVHWKIAQQ
jgi:hypothetical protein